MATFFEDTESKDVQMAVYTDLNLSKDKAVSLWDTNQQIEAMVRFGLFGMSLDDDTDLSETSFIRGYQRVSDGIQREFPRNLSACRNSQYAHLRGDMIVPSVYNSSLPIMAEASESSSERRIKQETQKSKERAERKRIKKRKQRERKRLEKLKQEERSRTTNEKVRRGSEQSQAEDPPVIESTKNGTGSHVQEMIPEPTSDHSSSTELESSDEERETKDKLDGSEDLDLASAFVRKAAVIASRKLEQSTKNEQLPQKQPVVKRKNTVNHESMQDQRGDKKDIKDASSTPSYTDNIRISTELAAMGNMFANDGEFDMAVKYFTDAIRYNPTEHKLFGNRSFCFERMREYEKALTDADLSLSMFPGWDKGLYRKGRALAGLKRYEEAEQAFQEVVKIGGSCADAARELLCVQIIQLMEHGFSREQSCNALIIHGTVNEALKVLSKLNSRPGDTMTPTHPAHNTAVPPQVVNISGVSPVLSALANTSPLQHQEGPTAPNLKKPIGPIHSMSFVHSKHKLDSNLLMKTSSQDNKPPRELFPIWVGNMFNSVTETSLRNIFSRVGDVYSVKVLTASRCAFINFTKQEYCEEAIRVFNGSELNGNKIAVRYPDRIPEGRGISRSALTAKSF